MKTRLFTCSLVLLVALAGCEQGQDGDQSSNGSPTSFHDRMELFGNLRAMQAQQADQEARQQEINNAPFLANLRFQQQNRPSSFNCAPNMMGGFHCQ